jgi:hypothetical protein
MQPSQHPSGSSQQVRSINQNQLNPPPVTAAQIASGLPFVAPLSIMAIDPESPLSKGIQNSPWPASYKPITLPKFNEKSDLHQFIMSFEAAVASTGGNETILTKSFIIAVEEDALVWYSMLKQSIVYSRKNLRDKILANFKGFASESLTSTDLFKCKQNQREALRDYF